MIDPGNRRQSEQFFLVVRALQHLVGPQTPVDSRRKSQRIPRSLSVSIQPLDENFDPVGEVFSVVSRDISMGGMGLLCPEPIEHRFVRLGIFDDSVTVIGEIRHNSPIGTHHPLFLVGVMFLD